MNRSEQQTDNLNLASGLANRMSVKELRQQLVVVTSNDPVIYQWWFRLDGASMLLAAIGEDHQNVKIARDIIQGNEYLGLYAGKGKSCRQRFDWHIRQHHDARTVRHGFLSTLRQTLSALLGYNAVDAEDAVNKFIDEYCYLDWTCYPRCSKEQLSELEEERIHGGYFPLNIQSNPNVPREIIKTIRMLRRLSKRGGLNDSSRSSAARYGRSS